MTAIAPNINRLWADLIVEELIRLGITSFVIAPGSRSTPLVTAAADNPRAKTIVHFDERGTAFHALGCARATGRPAAWITTSGTAVANGYPAVVEAAQDCIPLILITADRPPELRDTAANQTIDQQHVFGRYVRWFFDLPVPNVSIDPHFVLTTVDQAVHRAMSAPAGPVHLNCMFREPLAPVEDGFEGRALTSQLAGWQGEDRPLTRYVIPRRSPRPEAVDELATVLRHVEKGIVVAGRLPSAADVEPVSDLARALNWPLLADVNSQLRHARPSDGGFLPYHALLTSEVFREGMRPQAVIQFGTPPVSKRLGQFIAATPAPMRSVVADGPFRADPEHRVGLRFDCDVAEFCRALQDAVQPVPARWIDRWKSLARVAHDAIDDALADDESLSEPWIARALPEMLPGGSGLFLGNSMPVRDADAFAFAGTGIRVGANRGASGIDGTLATASGFCAGSAGPVTLVIGDLALLHDLNSLALARLIRQPFPIVAINNDGAAIFSFLQIAEFDDVFEPYFGTPHGIGFKPAAEMFGIPYSAPGSRADFVSSMREALQREGPTLLEVRTNRSQNATLHRTIDERVALAVTRAVTGASGN